LPVVPTGCKREDIIMNFFDMINEYAEYIMLGLAGVSLLLIILIIILLVKQKKLSKKYKKFMMGASGENLESQIIARFADIDQLKASTKSLEEELDKVKKIFDHISEGRSGKIRCFQRKWVESSASF
jgi:hypothetical protein